MRVIRRECRLIKRHFGRLPVVRHLFGDGIVKRIGFGVLWFVALWIGISALGGGIAGALAQARSPPPTNGAVTLVQGYATGHDAGFEFGRRYGGLIFIAALLASIIGTATGVLPGTRGKTPTAKKD